MVEPPRWRPLLDGQLAERAAGALAGILEWIERRADDPVQDPSVGGGAAGLAILHAYIARARSDQAAASRADRALEDAIDAAASLPLTASLHGGLTGVAWAAEHLSADRAWDPNEDVGGALMEYLDETPWRRPYDLIAGLTGVGVYALERLPRDSAAASCLARVLDRLEESAERLPSGITWRTRPDGTLMERSAAGGRYDLGVAHGVPGVIALLGGMLRAGVERSRANALLHGAMRWLLAQRLPDGAGARFPSWIEPGVDPRPARTAWCYGDPGVAAALLIAGSAAGEAGWVREAIAIARPAAARPFEETGVIDAGLCHGAAGLGHVFNRIAQATGDAELAEAARMWFERALSLRRPGQGIDGYVTAVALPESPQGPLEWRADPSLLTGVTGVALSLLAATSALEPAWDRLLLLSLP